MNIILKAYHGSQLYGTNTPASDKDIKGIYLPSIKDVILQNVPKEIDKSTNKTSDKNTSKDIDEGYYSLHYFLKLAQRGETVALDMLHIPPYKNLDIYPDNKNKYNDIWGFIYENRSKFYTKNMKAFVGYCRTQASKYGVKGSRLASAKRVLDMLKTCDPNTRLSEIWTVLWEDEHCKFINIPDCREQDSRAWEICSRKLMANTKVGYCIKTIQHFYDAYGERARKVMNNEGIDWKAISHAFRAGVQLREIYATGDLKFPLKNAQFLLDIKQGNYHYKNDQIGEKLEYLIDNIKKLANASNLPETVDINFWDNWLISLYKGE